MDRLQYGFIDALDQVVALLVKFVYVLLRRGYGGDVAHAGLVLFVPEHGVRHRQFAYKFSDIVHLVLPPRKP